VGTWSGTKPEWHTDTTLLLNEQVANLCCVQALLRYKEYRNNRPLHVHRFQAAAHRCGKRGCTRKLFPSHEPSSTKKGKGLGRSPTKLVVQLVFSRLLRYKAFVGCQYEVFKFQIPLHSPGSVSPRREFSGGGVVWQPLTVCSGSDDHRSGRRPFLIRCRHFLIPLKR
jgi:hypothetical protein